MATDGLQNGAIDFNWLFLVESVTIAIVVIFYLFYFNRVLGWLVAAICNLYLRKFNYNASVEFEAIQLSLLAGRVLFRNARYHSINQSLRIVKGHLTCRYWYLRTQGMESDGPTSRQGNPLSPSSLPHRWLIAFEGAEWFVYNRTAAFDVILEHLGFVNPLDPASDSTMKKQGESPFERPLRSSNSQTTFKVQNPPSVKTNHQPNDKKQDNTQESMMSWALRDALPVRIEGNIGVVTIGNPSTSSILVFTFQKAHGVYSAPNARSRHDFFRQDFKFSFVQTKIVLRTNPDYNRTLKEHGATILNDLQSDPNFRQAFDQPIYRLLNSASFAQFSKYFSAKSSGLFNWIHPTHQPEVGKVPGVAIEPDGFVGLPRFVQTTTPAHPAEYAKVTTILTSRIMNFRYYLDSPGKVPADPLTVHHLSTSLSLDPEDGLPPEYGIDIKLVDAKITYGPWADRQRAVIHKAIFPPQRFDNVETPQPFGPGDQRAHTELLVKVDLENCQVRVPIREPSKDWQWLTGGTTTANNQGSDVRPYGWLDLSIGPGSEIVLTQSQIPQKDGYEMVLQFRMMDVEARSSVNNKVFARIPMVLIIADMPTPLIWDSPRTWKYRLTLSEKSYHPHDLADSKTQPRVSLIRDHIQFVIDLIKDWLSGPPTLYEEWVPTTYEVELKLMDYDLYLNLNDLNVIENFDFMAGSNSNILLLLCGQSLTIQVVIPGELYRPPVSTTSFSVQFDDLSVKLDYPDWSTQHSFATDSALYCAELGRVSVQGYYDANDLIKPEAVDFLNLTLEMDDVLFKAFGHLFRLMLNIKENYLGSYHHSFTQEEFIAAFKKGIIGAHPDEINYRATNSNTFEMDLKVIITNLLLAFPQDSFDCEEVVFCAAPSSHCFLKNHASFMDMTLETSPLRFQPATDWEHLLDDPIVRRQILSGDFSSFHSQTRVRLESIQLTALRLFGPLPEATTYFGDWRCSIGQLTGELAISDVEAFARFASVVGEGFVDKANSMFADFPLPVEPDVTFGRVSTEAIDLIIVTPRSRARLHFSSGIQLSYNDLASDLFKIHTELVVPAFGFYLLVPDPTRGGDIQNPAIPWLEVASCTGNLEVSSAAAALGWEEKAQNQREFLEEQDFQTKRCHFLYPESVNASALYPHLPAAAKDILDDLQRSPIHDPHAVIDGSDDGNSLRSHVTNARGSDSSAEQSETDGRVAAKNLRRERLLYQRRLSVSAPRVLRSVASPIPAAPYATALPSWRYYGFNPDIPPQQPTFLAMRAGLFPPQSIQNRPGNGEHAPFYVPRMKASRNTSPQRKQVLGRKYLDLRMKTPLDLFFTPLCVEVVDDMLETLMDNDIEADGPSFYNRLLGSLSANPSPNISTSASEQVLEFFVSMPLIRLRLLQDIASAFEPIGISSISANAPPLSAISLQVENVCLDGKSPALFSKGPLDSLSLPQNVQASIDGFQFLIRQDPRSAMDHFFLDLTPHSETTAGTVFALQSGFAELKLSHDGHRLQSAATSSDLSCSFVERAAETLAGSFASLVTHLARTMSLILKYGHHKQEMLRRVIYRLIANDVDTMPSCLRRSPFWTHISPSSHRSSFAWYCSIRLRQLALSITNKRAPINHESNLSETAIKNTLVAWSKDHGGDSDVGSLDRFLPRLGPISKTTSSVPPQSYILENHSFLLRTGCFVVRFIHTANSPTSTSALRNCDNFFQLAPTTLLVATQLSKDSVALGCYLNTGTINCKVDPQFSSLAQHIVTLVHAFRPKVAESPLVQQDLSDPVTLSPKTTHDGSSFMSIFSKIELSIVFGGARLQAAVHRLGTMIELGKLSLGFRLENATPSVAFRPNMFSSSAHLERIGIYLSEISLAHLSSTTEPVLENLLMSATIENITTNARNWPDSSQSSSNVKLLILLGSIHISVGRSLVKMEEFVRDWRQREVASRIVPMYHKILEAWKSEPAAQSPSSTVWNWSLSLEFHLAAIAANFQPIPRLEVVYSLQGLSFTDFKASLRNGQFALSGGIAVDQHNLSFTSTTEKPDSEATDLTRRHHGLLKFPSLQMLFSYSNSTNPSLHLDLAIDFFSAYLSINWLDTILTMTARYGEDINELIHLLRPPVIPPISTKIENSTVVKSSEPPLQIFAEIMLSGFELSILAPKPLPRIECRRVKGTIHPKFRHLELTECAISLAPLEQTTGNMQSFARFVFDLFLSNQSPAWAFTPQTDHDPTREDVLEITADFQRIHAVAATSAFKLLLDCIQYLQLEFARIKTVHQAEMAEAESRIEQAWSSAQNQYTSSEPLLQRLIFAGRCSQFGLAIPLDDPPSNSSQSADPSSPPQSFKGAALFISFTQLVTWSRLGQTAQASVELFAIQSVSQLDPSLVEHFESASHETRNSVFVPHLDVKFGLTARPQAPTLLTVKASAPSGITIDMSPSILLIVHAFLDVYERDSHLIVNLLESQTQTSDVEPAQQDPHATVEPNISLSPTITDPWSIRVDFDTGVGGGGKIQLHTFDLAQDDADFVEILQRANVSLGRINVDVAHSDLFFLPGVSAWAVYNPISPTTDAALHIDIVVHSSQNTLNPTLLRFVSQMSAAANRRVCPKSDSTTRTPSIKPPTTSAATTKSSILSTNLSFGLRIDRSELTITCLPTRALAKLQWASGVLFASGRLDKSQFNAACTVSKIAAFLRHEHGFDSALKAEAGDMVASLDWRALRPATRQHTHTCSVLLKFSELLTEVDFNHLNICLLFKAIWLDQVTPPAQPKSELDAGKGSKPSESVPQNDKNDTTILLVAVLADNIKFLLRLSPSVGTIHLGTTPLNLRVRHIPSVSRSLVLDVGETSGVAVGDGLLGGRAHLQQFTLLISVEDLSSDTILDINATIGPMEVYFTVSSETILLLRTDLIQGAVQDDWKDIKSLDGNSPENLHGRKDLSLRTSLHLRSINVLATLYTASRGKSVLDAIESQVHQQNAQAEDVLSQLPPGMIVRREKDTLLNVAQRLENERSSPPTHSVNEIKIVGSLQLTTHNISLVLFAGQFGDMPLLRMQLEATQAFLTRTPTTTHMLYNLSFTTEGCQVAHLNLPPNGLSEATQSDGSWYEALGSVPCELVLNANRLWISMSASEALEKNQVSHTFRAEMPNNIHISTDVTTHANLWSKFRSAWNRANEVKGSADPFMAQDHEPKQAVEGLVLVAETPPVIEDAKVQELWHATLPLVNYFKWNENLPKYTLIRVIKPLDNVIDFFEGVYESTFARHQFKKPSSA
ncbi:hypothetical protein PGT21_022120 [Puccinia graminis f. sp. tritici]|uniref:Csf1 N-terminal domain-containing protein n=1 Tax=Puccinia graminis f. sp. tritici TaxID=56615 RepID=A0A5B0MFC3_PUCGR|nr:hypothetical protein PGT21_022120 [Puccinia graminis f. sp. tritici]